MIKKSKRHTKAEKEGKEMLESLKTWQRSMEYYLEHLGSSIMDIHTANERAQTIRNYKDLTPDQYNARIRCIEQSVVNGAALIDRIKKLKI